LGQRHERIEWSKEQERLRLEDAGWIFTELNLTSKGEVDIKFLRPTHTGRRHEHVARDLSEAQQAISRIEKHRALTLVLLKKMLPGSEIVFRLLKKKNQETSKASEEIDPEKVDGYLVLVTPQGDAIGECLIRGATYIFRHETGQTATNPYDWSTVFDDDKDHAVKHGAVRFQHPTHNALSTGLTEVVTKYVDAIATELLWDLMPGEQLPEPKQLRRIGKTTLELAKQAK
jgi:hypothetical protein